MPHLFVPLFRWGVRPHLRAGVGGGNHKMQCGRQLEVLPYAVCGRIRPFGARKPGRSPVGLRWAKDSRKKARTVSTRIADVPPDSSCAP